MEQSFVAWAKMRARRLPPVKLGIGDDASVHEVDGADLVVTCDSLLEGSHFRLAECEPDWIGRKLVNVNVSDLAAMAAEPLTLHLSMCLPKSNVTCGNVENKRELATDELAAEIFEGVCQACEVVPISLAGGDTNVWDGPLALHATASGKVIDGEVWQRASAQPDDLIVVTGPLGGSILGKHLSFSPRVDWVSKVRGKVSVNAAMDITDGLSVDLLRMCDASHCGAVLDLDAIPTTQAAVKLAESSGKKPVEHALGDGEDFELLLAIAPSDIEALQDLVGSDQAVVCGEFISRTGLWAKDGGKIRQMWSTGFVHGAD